MPPDTITRPRHVLIARHLSHAVVDRVHPVCALPVRDRVNGLDKNTLGRRLVVYVVCAFQELEYGHGVYAGEFNNQAIPVSLLCRVDVLGRLGIAGLSALDTP